MPEIKIDLNPVVGAILRVMTEPFKTLINKLQAEGRLTKDEVDTLFAEINDRGDRLADLVQEELRKSEDLGE